VSVLEPSDALNAGMAIQTKGRQLAPLISSLVSWLVVFLVTMNYGDMRCLGYGFHSVIKNLFAKLKH
jgi:hypothetical protein